ncbi:hypothetical protein AB2T56_07375 [Clostridium butyricum]|uniref:hypothetical protein n=1 Tax=Clostridium butyricum TaxID=1492 RepID=UPI003465541C
MIKLYCVIQEIELKKENTYGEYKELEAYKNEWTFNGEDIGGYNYRYTGGRFERSIKKAYKISIHHSYRENGNVKKKQWCVCTMSYYDVIQFSLYDCASRKIERLSEELNIDQETIYNLIYLKLDPLIKQIEEEYHQTEEYKVHSEHEKIIKKHIDNKSEFEKKYGEDTYDHYYDIFGVLRENEKFQIFKKQYEATQEQQRSYYKNYQSNYNSNYDFSSCFNTKQSNYTGEQKEYLKKIYRAGAAKLHPDVTKDDGAGMKFLNKLKENWGI